MSDHKTTALDESPEHVSPVEPDFRGDELADALGRAFASIASEIDELTRDRPAIRHAIHLVAHGLAAATSQPAPSQTVSAAPLPGTVVAATDSPSASVQTEPAQVMGRDMADQDLVPADASQIATLRIGGEVAATRSESNMEPRATKPRYSDVTDDDLDIIIERTRLKSEGARWAVERDERQRDGNDFATQIRPGDQDVIQRARDLPHCFLWMNQSRGDVRVQADDFLLIADCFDALAESLITLQATLQADCRESFRKAIDLVAEAQSALRMAVSRVEEHPDSDQQMVYHWLRNRASVESFYIDRYMRITDPADPERCDDVMDQTRDLRDSLGKSSKLVKQKIQSLGKARYHLNRLTQHDEAFDRGEWERVVATIDQLVEDGTPPSSVEVRETLLPYVDQIPELDLPPGFLLVLREIDRWIASEAPVDSRPIGRDATPEVQEVAELLNC